MTTVTTWLKHLAGAFLACLLLVSFMAPAVRAGLCEGDPGVTVAKSAQVAAHGDVDASILDDRESGAEDVCPEGHCHHGSPLIDGAIAQHAFLQLGGARLVPAPLGIPSSLEPDGPSEPPRA